MATQYLSTAQLQTVLVNLARAHDEFALRQIIKTHNQRLYRLARAIVGNNADAEEVVQEAYIHAFRKLGSFREESSLSTWLSRITINEALMRQRSKRRQKRSVPLTLAQNNAQIIDFPFDRSVEDPERTMAQRQILQLVEDATDTLPAPYRMVFVARVIEGLSTEETALLFDIEPATVKTRLFRARKLIRDRIEAQIGPVILDAFPFAGHRCARLTEAVMERLRTE